jgi:hypothetical protein
MLGGRFGGIQYGWIHRRRRAGMFDCLEIRMSTVGEDTYTLYYYSPEVKSDIKQVEQSGMTVIGITELVSYDVS